MAREGLQREPRLRGGQGRGGGHRTGCDASAVADARRTGTLRFGGGTGGADGETPAAKPPTTTKNGSARRSHRAEPRNQSARRTGNEGKRRMAEPKTATTAHDTAHIALFAAGGTAQPRGNRPTAGHRDDIGEHAVGKGTENIVRRH